MKDTKYLYDCSSKKFMNLIYKDALIYKIKKAKKLLHKLTWEDNMEDTIRISKVSSAIKHNEELLKGK